LPFEVTVLWSQCWLGEKNGRQRINISATSRKVSVPEQMQENRQRRAKPGSPQKQQLKWR